MTAGTIVALITLALSLISSLLYIGIRLGKLEQRIYELDKDVAALIPIATTITRIGTQFESVSSLIASHMASHGHEWSLIQLARLDEQLTNLKQQLKSLPRRNEDTH